MPVSGLRPPPAGQIASLVNDTIHPPPRPQRRSPRPAFRFSPAEHQWLRRAYPKNPVHLTVAAFNARFGHSLTARQLSSANTSRGLPWRRAKRRGVTRLLSPEEQAWFRRNFPRHPRKGIQQRFQRRFGRFLTLAQLDNLGTCLDLRGAPNTGRFKPGHIPANKGRKGFVAPGSEATQFQKGSVPPNRRPLYAERWTHNKQKKPILEIKVPVPNPYTGAATRWIRKAVWTWTQAHGPVPRGHAVILLDGDETNCDLDNLVCCPRSVLQRLNAPWNKADRDRTAYPIHVRIAQIHDRIGKLEPSTNGRPAA